MDEQIVALLKRRREGLTLLKIIRGLGLSSRQSSQVKRHLKNLEVRGIIQRVRSRYFIPAGSGIIRGTFLSSGGGFGFVKPETEGEEDIFIPARYTSGALQGDRVEVLSKAMGRKGKPEGRVVKIVKKGRERVVGIYREYYGLPRFLPFDTPHGEEIPLSSVKPFAPQPGMIVEADRDTMRLTAVYGMPEEPGVDLRVAIQRYSLSSAFSEESKREAEGIPLEIQPVDTEGRVDYRSSKTMTIDGENAQDFDDAVSVRKRKDGKYFLGVHIADVSHFVHPGTSLDREAFSRGTSVYFPDRTLPMLPEKLSNLVCSLRPREERLTFSVLMEVDQEGEVLRSEFHPSIIRTAERMTYDSVYRIFQGDKLEKQKYRHLVRDLLLMRELARLLRQSREQEGSLDFDLLEPELVYREGKLHSVISFEPNEAHWLIEEFMLAANEAVASFLSQNGVPMLYRIHPQPSLSSLSRLREMLTHFNIFLPEARKLNRKDLQQAIVRVEGRSEKKFVTLQILKALKLAVYSEENQGHFGLAKSTYTHFTSPIRRYPDLVVHRILKKALRGERVKMPSLSSIALHCSQKERDAEAAERELVEWRILRYLREKLGNDFEGIIVGISKAGLVVELDTYFVQGVVPFADLSGDFFYKKSEKTLVGRRTGKKFELGDRITVLLAAVDPLRRRMDFTLSNGG